MAMTLTRPAVSIERLPGPGINRTENEQREAMNCKSCRKRKIKCNRLRPKCESCKVFQCPCLYDAVPKKRGPKTEVLESLLKRVDDLERRHRGEKKSPSVASILDAAVESGSAQVRPGKKADRTSRNASNEAESPLASLSTNVLEQSTTQFLPPTDVTNQETNEFLLDVYFERIHDRPYHIVDEAMIRRQHLMRQLPACLRLAISAVAASIMPQYNGQQSSLLMSEDLAIQARAQIDMDEPGLVAIQSLLLLHTAFFAAGRGKKAYMCLNTAITMALALEMHREISSKVSADVSEREIRRQIFWACYLLDRFNSCGSRRPMIISDDSVILRLPSWIPYGNTLSVEGEFFSPMNFRPQADTVDTIAGSIVMLIDIARILGTTNGYLANGGVKGEMHFPWHSSSSLFQIRAELDLWASSNEEILSSNETLLTRPDNVVLFLSKLTYHVIHTLVYRPFLPVDLAELLQGSGQHKSFQIEATHLCFLHANAITSLVSTAIQVPNVEWPYLVGYALTTAGTVHIHGAHYKGQEGDVFYTSSDSLTKEVQILAELRYQCASIQHQRDLLQSIFLAHADMIKAPMTNPLKYSPVFHLKDFFDRYPGRTFDGAYLSLKDVEDVGSSPPQRRKHLHKSAAVSARFPPQLQLRIPPAGQILDHPQTAPIASSQWPQGTPLASNASLQHSDHLFGPFTTTKLPSSQSAFPFSPPPSTTGPFDQSLLFPISNGERPDEPNTKQKEDRNAFHGNEESIPISDSSEKPAIPAEIMQSLNVAGEDRDDSDGIDPFLMLLEQFAENDHLDDFDIYLRETEP